MSTSQMNAAAAAAHARGEDDVAALAAVYQGALERAAGMAGRAFAAMTAAAAWQPPPEGNVLAAMSVVATGAALRARRLHERLLAAVAEETSARLAIAWDVKHPLAAALLAKAGGRTGERLGLAVQPVLRDAIRDAYEQGLSVPDASALIREKLAGAAPWQADMLARTDLNGLANGGSLIAARLAGAPFKSWLATNDDRTRETHAEADGQTVPVDQPFTVGGEQLDFPGDPAGSDAEVANCRCTLVYSDSLAASAASPTRTRGGTMPAKTASRSRKAALAAKLPQGVKAMPDGVRSCSMQGTPGYSGGGACHIHDGSEQGMRAAMRKARRDANAKKGAASSLAASSTPGAIPFSGVAAIEGLVTDDNSPIPRVLLARSLSWPDMPVPFMAQTVTADAHDGAQVAGRIDSFQRKRGPDGSWLIAFKGELTTPFGINEIAPMIADETLRGVSIDMGAAQWAIVDRDTLAIVPENELEVDAMAAGKYLLGCKSAKIRAATLTPVQAIEGANVALAASAGGEATSRVAHADLHVEVSPLTASAAPARPPRAWFETTEPPGKMPLTITDEGRVFGHIATWDTCFTGHANVCTTPPRSRSGYSYFHVGEVELADGKTLPVGKLMLASKGGKHAPLSASQAEASRHYDDTSMVAAHLRATDGKHGIWVAGALNPLLSAERVRELRTLPPSGDWRPVNGQLELIAALAVPVPGFPVPRAEAGLIASGEETEVRSLVASSGRIDPTPRAVRALEQAGLVTAETRALDARARALLARAEGGVDALVELAAAPVEAAPPRRAALVSVEDVGEPPVEKPAETAEGSSLDEQLEEALGTLAHVTDMASRVQAAEEQAAKLAALVEAVREEQRQETVAQKRETLAAIEAMTAQIAAGGKISEAMLAAMNQLTERKPRTVKVVRDEDGRPVAYEEATV